MKTALGLVICILLSVAAVTPAAAECYITDEELEAAILSHPDLNSPGGRQMILDLRHLQVATFILWTHKRQADCERLAAVIGEIVAPEGGESGPLPIDQNSNGPLSPRDQFASVVIDGTGASGNAPTAAVARATNDKVKMQTRNLTFGPAGRGVEIDIEKGEQHRVRMESSGDDSARESVPPPPPPPS